ncbi:MAG: hypothetical protein KAH84_06285 [Thiomargarita sp.]|nr:hypothetical protein [Thiomargarita sp.]
MLKIIQLLTIGICFSISNIVIALGEESTISEDEKKIFSQIEKEFKFDHISISTKKEIINQYSFALQKGWYSWWLGTDDLLSNNLENEKVKIYDLIIINDDRINNITFTYFPSVGQIFCVQKQYVEASSDTVLERFKEYKNKDDMEIKKETNNYAFIKRKEYVEFSLFHMKAPNGLISYIDAKIINIK